VARLEALPAIKPPTDRAPIAPTANRVEQDAA
jgi:hypothetical protein